MTSKFEIKKHILPLYLIVVLLLQVDLTIQNILLGCIPLLMISLSLHLQNKKLGIMSIFFFYSASVPLIVVSRIDDFQILFLEMLLVILPSIVVLYMILHVENKDTFHLPAKRPLLVSLVLLTVVFIIFSLAILFSFQGYFVSSQSIEGQILLLAEITTLCCTPFLISRKIE
ncbi:MAG: hypothetical protein MUO73_09615 [Thermoplasmata archaeon]|nr:hypothetical protein [Thermoplasmata archaeon]